MSARFRRAPSRKQPGPRDEIDALVSSEVIKILRDSPEVMMRSHAGEMMAKQVAIALVRGAIDGDASMMKMLLERSEGIPKQRIASTKGSPGVQIVVEQGEKIPDHLRPDPKA